MPPFFHISRSNPTAESAARGHFLARTTGVATARLAVDTFRNIYALNYETIAGAARVEPSLSQ